MHTSCPWAGGCSGLGERDLTTTTGGWPGDFSEPRGVPTLDRGRLTVGRPVCHEICVFPGWGGQQYNDQEIRTCVACTQGDRESGDRIQIVAVQDLKGHPQTRAHTLATTSLSPGAQVQSQPIGTQPLRVANRPAAGLPASAGIVPGRDDRRVWCRRQFGATI